MKGDDPHLLFWTNAIPVKKGNWESFKDGKESGYLALLKFLTSKRKEANLLFYNSARELEDYKAKPSKYFEKFNALCKSFLDETANNWTIPEVKIGRDTLHKLEPYFVPQQVTDAMKEARTEIYHTIVHNFWGAFKTHLRSKAEDNFAEINGKLFYFRWVKRVPTKYLPGEDSRPSAYWMDAILLEKDGGWDDSNFEKSLQKSGYCKFKEFIELHFASENPLFYARARELQQYHNDRAAYLTKFTALFQDLVENQNEAVVTINIEGVRTSELKAAYRRFHV